MLRRLYHADRQVALIKDSALNVWSKMTPRFLTLVDGETLFESIANIYVVDQSLVLVSRASDDEYFCLITIQL